MRVLAVDDEQPALDELLYLLRAEPAVTELHGAADATGALRILRAHAVDAVFLDINMPGLDGMELAGVLAEFVHPPAIVFVTAHEDHAVAAFDLGAVDYLLKPVRRQRLGAAVGGSPTAGPAPIRSRSRVRVRPGATKSFRSSWAGSPRWCTGPR
jgi:DNA-binding LytR/AlgR family response regulator